MDWLLARQARVERGLARRHLTHGDLVLYDVTSTYPCRPRSRRSANGSSLRAWCWSAPGGVLTEARLREDLRPIEGLDWITALRAPVIQALAAGGALQLTLFDQRDLADITHPDYPEERLIVCKNPLLAEERARKCRECSRRPNASSPRSPPLRNGPRGRSGVEPRLPCGWARSWGGAKVG
jgi:hypothetical protein